MTQSIEKALAFRPPSRSEAKDRHKLMQTWFSPQFEGLDNIDTEKPTLFVGNHTRYGVLDVPLLAQGIYLNTGIFPRGLADRLHYNIPYWRDTLGKSGVVIGSREMCSALMQAGESIMVFPGGAREVVKGKGANYELLWGGRLGFVRMAVAHGYSITPFASVGAEESLDLIFDGDEIMRSPVGRLLKKRGWDKYLRDGEFLFPIPRGIGLSMFPRPEPFYFSFGKPIETVSAAGRQDDKRALRRIQDKVATSVNQQIKDMLVRQSRERDSQPLARRILRRL